MIERLTGKRLYLFLLVTFGLSWTAWWSLATIARPIEGVFAHPLSSILFAIGGLGPTIAPLVAVALTPAQGTLGEFASRLFRWRVNPIWWLAALAIPPSMAWLIEHIDLLFAGPAVHASPLQPLPRLAVLFPLMIIGGGLEELGWRGVAQPELERRFNPVIATVVVAFFWALWHLPLFFIPGVAQDGTNFGFFALQILGTAFITAWLYDSTRSILLCIFFHAAGNTAGAMGLIAPDVVPTASILLGCAIRLAIGLALLVSLRGLRTPLH
jgi:membrane protease YdiL (CAAX protease family)